MAKAKRGDLLSCAGCGLVLVVDEACGCAEADIVCCEQPMAKGKLAAAKARKKSAAKAVPNKAAKTVKAAAPKPAAKAKAKPAPKAPAKPTAKKAVKTTKK